MSTGESGDAVPRSVRDLEAGRELDEPAATAAKLWLEIHGERSDPTGRLREAVRAWWSSRPGADPYWDFLATRGSCATCGESYRYENLSICPECLKTFCPPHRKPCGCGFRPLG